MPTGSQQGLNINEADTVRKGLATAAVEDGATSGQVASVTNGELEFVTAGGGSQAVSVETKTLNTAEVRALPTTGITVLAAQGNDTVIVPVHATLRLTWAADYGNISVNSSLELMLGTTSNLVGALSESEAFGVSSLLAPGGPDGSIALLSASSRIVAAAPFTYGNSGILDGDVENLPLVLKAGNTGDYTGGNGNSLKVTLIYYVLAF